MIRRAQRLDRMAQDGMEAEIPNDEYCKHDPEKEDQDLEKSY